MHLNSELLFEEYAKPLFASGMKVLEIGPDGFPSTYRKIVGDDSLTWETMDIYSSDELTYTATDEYTFPIDTGEFDIVLSGQVIEHVRKVWVWTREVARVCKQDGFVITISPVSWPYHMAPIDCWRMYPEAMEALYDDAGLDMMLSKFESLEPRKLLSPFRLLQAFKLALGRTPVELPIIDTISIGIKK